jgi:hypothetical protein
MFVKTVLAGIVALGVAMTAAHADVVFDTILDPVTQSADRANVFWQAGQTFATGILTLNGLGTVQVQGPRDQLNTTPFSVAIVNDIDQDGTTWDPGSTVGVSAEFQGFSAVNEVLTWTFAGEALTDNTVYGILFTDATGTADPGVLRVGYENSGTGIGAGTGAAISESVPFLGGAVWDIAATVNTIPEPSVIALTLIGGLALAGRRRRG